MKKYLTIIAFISLSLLGMNKRSKNNRKRKLQMIEKKSANIRSANIRSANIEAKFLALPYYSGDSEKATLSYYSMRNSVDWNENKPKIINCKKRPNIMTRLRSNLEKACSGFIYNTHLTLNHSNGCISIKTNDNLSVKYYPGSKIVLLNEKPQEPNSKIYANAIEGISAICDIFHDLKYPNGL